MSDAQCPTLTPAPDPDLPSVLALSTHGVFEGLAAGLEEDESGVWTMFTGQGTLLDISVLR